MLDKPAFLCLVMGAALFVLGVAVSLILFCIRARADPLHPREKHIQILVLGDLGRSPRMQYHALSILKHGGSVDLIGYHESPLHPDFQHHDGRLNVVALPRLPDVLKSLPFLVQAPIKIVWQNLSLFYNMYCNTQPSNWIIVQNPPSIPTLHTALILSILSGSHIMIDWHNYGWSILATARGKYHPFVQAYRKYEAFWGSISATANLTVTDAMARDLAGPKYNVTTPILTLHDRPAAIFRPIDWKFNNERKRVLQRVLSSELDSQPLVERILAGNTRLIVSSTSWTPDEDFGLLLDALVHYAAGTDENAPKFTPPASSADAAVRPNKPLVAVITGKGPEKAAYTARIGELVHEGRLRGIRIITAWLPLDLYADLLACADLGVCLHMSSSGLDLPMKVVDMFGAGLPVVAYSGYESFGELVKEGVNGCGFRSARGLSNLLIYLLNETDKTDPALDLDNLRRGAGEEGSLRWDEEWDRVVGRIVGLIDP